MQCLANSDTLNSRLLQLEYQIFMQTDDSSRALIIIDKARLLRENAMYEQAIEQLERISSIQPANITIAADADQAFCYFKLQRFDLSLFYSRRITEAQYPADTIITYIYMQSLVQCGQYTACKEKLREWGVPGSILLSLPDSVAELDPWKYRRRSLIPGYGQLSLGKPRQAMASFALTGGFAGIAVYSGISLLPVTALIYGVVPCIKFYSGGRINAANLTRSQNTDQRTSTRSLYADCINALFIGSNP